MVLAQMVDGFATVKHDVLWPAEQLVPLVMIVEQVVPGGVQLDKGELIELLVLVVVLPVELEAVLGGGVTQIVLAHVVDEPVSVEHEVDWPTAQLVLLVAVVRQVVPGD